MKGIKTTLIAPKWENKTAPCGGVGGCPAGTNIAGALYALSRGWADMAWQIMMETHPFRATLGRVCYAFCEKPCNRGYFDKPIAIQHLEMVIGDLGFDPAWRPDIKRKNGKKIVIIGAGPAGLTAAYFLVRAGYSVDVFDAEDRPGGMMRYGIPEYRLDRKVLDREIELVLSLGVKLHTNSRMDIKGVKALLTDKKIHAVLVATGAGTPIKAGFDGMVVNGLDFLRQTQKGKKDSLEGKRIMVIGGGNTAMDTCRTAVRLGASSVAVAYRRTEDEMPAHREEYMEAREEGVAFRFLLSPVKYSDGKVLFQKNRMGEADASGRRNPEPIPGETEEIAADIVFAAIGQSPEKWNLSPGKKLFFAGDVSEGSRGTVIHAIADGKKAAAEIHSMLSGGKALFAESRPEIGYESMNVARYYQKRMRLRTPLEPASVRSGNFEAVVKPVSKGEAMLEAERCFKCGTCLGGNDSPCDWCFHACKSGGMDKKLKPWSPDDVFFEITEDCDGCGKCWEDCPRFVVTPTEFGE